MLENSYDCEFDLCHGHFVSGLFYLYSGDDQDEFFFSCNLAGTFVVFLYVWEGL